MIWRRRLWIDKGWVFAIWTGLEFVSVCLEFLGWLLYFEFGIVNLVLGIVYLEFGMV